MPDKYVSKDNIQEILSQYSTSVLSKINKGSAYEAYKNGLLSTEIPASEKDFNESLKYITGLYTQNNGNLVVNPFPSSEYHVNLNTGSDDNSGLTSDTAFKTFQKAFDMIPSYSSSSFKVYLDGDYGTQLIKVKNELRIVNKHVKIEVYLAGQYIAPMWFIQDCDDLTFYNLSIYASMTSGNLALLDNTGLTIYNSNVRMQLGDDVHIKTENSAPVPFKVAYGSTVYISAYRSTGYELVAGPNAYGNYRFDPVLDIAYNSKVYLSGASTNQNKTSSSIKLLAKIRFNSLIQITGEYPTGATDFDCDDTSTATRV